MESYSNKLMLVYAPRKVKLNQTFLLIFTLEHEHQDPDDDIFVSRKTRYTTDSGEERIIPISGNLTASGDTFHWYNFDQLMFYDPCSEESVGGVWWLEFLLQSSNHGVLSRVVVPIEVE